MPDRPNEPLDLESVRARLASENGPRFWSSLEEIADTETFRDFLHREFPREASVWEEHDEPGRRSFLKLMSASLALAGLTACTKQPDELILPYVKKPEEIIPGRPIYFASAFTLNGAAEGILVESHQGRPTKIEGNPDHPFSLGAAGMFSQASVLGLYDPDRSQTVLRYGSISDAQAFKAEVLGLAQGLKGKQGAGLRFLTESVVSPATRSLFDGILRDFPQAKWYQYEPAGSHGLRAGARIAFGEPASVSYDLSGVKVLLSLDSDFLTSGAGSLKYARQFADGRRVRHGHTEMSRFYAVDSSPNNTGALADHRWPVKASEVAGVAAAVAKALGVESGPIVASSASYVAAIVADLKANPGASLIVAGDGQPASVHALALAMNAALGNIGKSVIVTEPIEANAGVDQIEQLTALTKEMAAGQVEVLVVLGANPVYTAPCDLNFGEAYARVKTRIHLGLYVDETAELSHWHVPEAHYLESWGDARALDGTTTIQQPLIAPLYRGKSALDVLALFTAEPEKTAYDLVRGYWRTRTALAEGPFEDWWRKSVHDGVIASTAAAPKAVAVRAGWSAGLKAIAGTGTEIIFRPDLGVHDGRYSNNGWLQELPKAITKITWDNPVMVSVAMGEKMGLENGDIVEISYAGKKVTGPVWLQPGHPDGSITVILGYGRTRAGRVGNGVGYNAYQLRTSATPLFGLGATVTKTGDHRQLATTQDHWRMESPEKLGGAKRYLVRMGTIGEYKQNPKFAEEMEETPARELTLYPEHPYKGNSWGMVIDLTACNGCNACVIACQAENNIPVVGRDQVLKGREMHWLRIDRYYTGGFENPKPVHQPILCMQCENAPCEVVCPVAATVHSHEGLNDMVYNRCVGTRYCSHNCPYKVRRFNFLLYSDWTNETVAMQKNPDVSVRSRGVMEKCTYCTQRISEARILSERENRPVRDGEIVTACEQSCAAQAITFGNINDPESRVAKLKQDHLNYSLLPDLNTRPRTTYLAYLQNPNSALEKEG